MKPRILLMDNGAHMFSGGGQVFSRQLLDLLREKDFASVETLTSKSLEDDFVNRTLCRMLDRTSMTIDRAFPSFIPASSISGVIQNLAYIIRLRREAGKVHKNGRYDLIISNDLTDQ